MNDAFRWVLKISKFNFIPKREWNRQNSHSLFSWKIFVSTFNLLSRKLNLLKQGKSNLSKTRRNVSENFFGGIKNSLKKFSYWFLGNLRGCAVAFLHFLKSVLKNTQFFFTNLNCLKIDIIMQKFSFIILLSFLCENENFCNIQFS